MPLYRDVLAVCQSELFNIWAAVDKHLDDIIVDKFAESQLELDQFFVADKYVGQRAGLVADAAPEV